jgi:hypothetical protein
MSCASPDDRQDLPKLRWIVGSTLAFLLFFAAACTLYWLARWAWKSSIVPHTMLVRSVPVEAVIQRHDFDDSGTAANGRVYPRVYFKYELFGGSFEGNLIRHPQYVRINAEEGSIGEVFFDGPERMARANELLKQYPIGQKTTAWVNPEYPNDAMLVRQELDISPFLWGLAPACIIPALWVFFASVIKAILGRPRGRWLAFGWGLLTLAAASPVVWQYRQLADSVEAAVILRGFYVGLWLAGIALLGSMLPAYCRAGLAIGLILSFALIGGVGVAIAAFMGKSQTCSAGSSIPARRLFRPSSTH